MMTNKAGESFGLVVAIREPHRVLRSICMAKRTLGILSSRHESSGELPRPAELVKIVQDSSSLRPNWPRDLALPRQRQILKRRQ